MKKIAIISLLIIFSTTFSFGQSKKNISKEEITTKIEWKYIISGNNEKKVKNNVTKYDTKGNIIEEIKYDSNGKIKKRTTKKYNENNDVILKISYLPNGKLNKKTVYEYNNNFKKSKTEYNDKGKIVSKKEYEYLKN